VKSAHQDTKLNTLILGASVWQERGNTHSSFLIHEWGGDPMEAFTSYLLGLLGTFVQIERGGPEACQGWLQAVHADYLTLRAGEASDLHLPLRHIHSVTPLPGLEHPIASAADEGQPDTFTDLLKAHLGFTVRLYHTGPEVSLGTLLACSADHLILETAPGEHVCYTMFHIRSLYLVRGDADLTSPESEEPLQGR
jgi:spore coat protein B